MKFEVIVQKFFGFKPEKDTEGTHWSFSRLKLTDQRASDLRKFASPRHDQGHTSSCVAQSTVKALELKRIMQHGISSHVDLSRLSVYYLARELMNPSETNNDEGTYISLAADVLRRFGVCREKPSSTVDKSFWPFDNSKINTPPSWSSMRQAYLHKISAWYKIYSKGQNRVGDVIHALASGSPVVYGTKVGDNWLKYDGTPIENVSGSILGGHATVLVGWDPQGDFFWGENSWGKNWGPDDGFYKIRPDVISNSASEDFVVFTCGWEPWAEVKTK